MPPHHAQSPVDPALASATTTDEYWTAFARTLPSRRRRTLFLFLLALLGWYGFLLFNATADTHSDISAAAWQSLTRMPGPILWTTVAFAIVLTAFPDRTIIARLAYLGGRCPRCRYDIRRRTYDTCPECGLTLPPKP